MMVSEFILRSAKNTSANVCIVTNMQGYLWAMLRTHAGTLSDEALGLLIGLRLEKTLAEIFLYCLYKC